MNQLKKNYLTNNETNNVKIATQQDNNVTYVANNSIVQMNTVYFITMINTTIANVATRSAHTATSEKEKDSRLKSHKQVNKRDKTVMTQKLQQHN